MTTDEQPSPGAMDALRARFQQQSRKAQAYYNLMHAMRAVTGSDEAASEWMSEPLPAFGGKTPAQLVAEGAEAELLAHIQSLQPGARK